MSADTAFSEQLDGWLRSEGPKTLGALGDVFAEKSFAVTILLLMFVPALPLPTGGITHVFEAITVVLAAQMVLGRRTIWLPQRWQRRELGATTTGKAVLRLMGLVLMGFAIAAAAAPPFSGLDTLPALGAVAVALSIILEDVVVLGIGLALGAVGIALILTIGAALLRVVRHVP